MLKSQDILIALKLLTYSTDSWTFQKLADNLGISVSQIHSGYKRLIQVGLVNPATRSPIKQALLEFLIHGLKYVFPAEKGPIVRGIPTAHAAKPLLGMLSIGEDDLPPVWPNPNGKVRGYSLQPLCKTAPQAALSDSNLYEMLALIDAIRDGRARERKLAAEELSNRLDGK